jgi:hypothetical protein
MHARQHRILMAVDICSGKIGGVVNGSVLVGAAGSTGCDQSWRHLKPTKGEKK